MEEIHAISKSWATADKAVAECYHAFNESMSATLRDSKQQAALKEAFSRLRAAEKRRDEILDEWKLLARRLLTTVSTSVDQPSK
jgi:hypothetical protein